MQAFKRQYKKVDRVTTKEKTGDLPECTIGCESEERELGRRNKMAHHRGLEKFAVFMRDFKVRMLECFYELSEALGNLFMNEIMTASDMGNVFV